MSNINLEANLTKDPDLRYTTDGTPVCNIALAENRRYQQNGEWVSEVMYIDAVIWRQQGVNAAASLKKGDMVVLTGRLDMRQWDDPKTGVKRTKHEINVFSIAASLKFAQADLRKNAREDQAGTPVAVDPDAEAPEADAPEVELAPTGTDGGDVI